jgi:hypothetical protein
MPRSDERLRDLRAITQDIVQARARRVQQLLWKDGLAPGMKKFTDEEYAEFLQMQKAEARREQEGRATGTTAQQMLANPTVARAADAEVNNGGSTPQLPRTT